MRVPLADHVVSHATGLARGALRRVVGAEPERTPGEASVVLRWLPGDARHLLPQLPELYQPKTLAAIWTGTFGRAGLRAEVLPRDIVVKVEQRADGPRAWAEVYGRVYTPEGHHVGGFHRDVGLDEDGWLSVVHQGLDLETPHQGTGFATAFNAHAEAEYRRLGVERITFEQTKDVGGYAWARQGFEFRHDLGDPAAGWRIRAQASTSAVDNAREGGRIRDSEYRLVEPRLYRRGGPERKDMLASSQDVLQLALPDGTRLGKRILRHSTWPGGVKYLADAPRTAAH